MEVLGGIVVVSPFLTIALITFLPPCSSLSDDGVALLQIKAGFNFTGGGEQLSDWNPSYFSPCSWSGVSCHPFNSSRVLSLSLALRGVSGFISPSIGRLDMLHRLSLHHNNLHGSIPKDIGKCKELRAIYLNSNYLEGDIPLELGELPHLTILDLSNNMIGGIIPSSLGNLNHLLFLNLSSNSLVGEIPTTGRLPGFPLTSFVGNTYLCGKQVVKSCQESSVFPATLPPPRYDGYHGHYMKAAVIGAIAGSGILIIVLVICLSLYLVSTHKKSTTTYKDVKRLVDREKGGKLVAFHGELPYRTSEILEKLESLGEEHVVGSGGFGAVFCMRMDDGVAFALKQIDGFFDQFENRFERELEVLGRVDHPNLVPLRGYLNLPPFKYLIHDFMPMGSLDDMLHHGSEREVGLSWNARLGIALGSARGLSYLHHDCRPMIVHRDLKSSNVLLDEKLEPRVSDFGLTKLVVDGNSHVTTIVAGSFGYMAPEYLQSGMATDKCDVYSFGVLLLELVTGKRPTDTCFVSRGLNIVGWMNMVSGDIRGEEVVDERCRDVDMEKVGPVIEIAMRCTSADPVDRPSMLRVLRVLEQVALSSSPDAHSWYGPPHPPARSLIVSGHTSCVGPTTP